VISLSRDFVPVLVWASLLAGLTLAQFAFMAESYSYGLLGGAALATVLLGVGLLARGRRDQASRLLPELSYPAAVFGLGVAVALVGVPLGLWLLLPGAGVAALGLGGLLRERRAR
jgi:hypothetical protein